MLKRDFAKIPLKVLILNDLLHQGAISQEIHEKAVQMVYSELKEKGWDPEDQTETVIHIQIPK